MGKYGEITVGMIFGSYNATVKNYSGKFVTEQTFEQGYESEYIFKKDGKVVANASRSYTPPSKAKYIDFATIRSGSYTYSAMAKNNGKYINAFDVIQGKNQHAVDLNGNGKVDENEIFSGELDSEAYLKAKDENNLKKYTQYRYNNRRDNGWNGVGQ